MDQPKIERVLRLMQLLSGSRRYTIEELAERLDMSARMIYRYIDTFKSVGYAVRKEGGVPRLVKMDGRDDIAQLVHFTDEEAYVVNRLIDALDNGNVLKVVAKEAESGVRLLVGGGLWGAWKGCGECARFD